MERKEGAAKVGAGETAGCKGCGLPLAQALGESGACRCPGGLRMPSEFSETSVWLFEAWNKFRDRDQAAITALHSLVTQINEAEHAKRRRGFLLSAAAGAVCGALAAAAYFSMR